MSTTPIFDQLCQEVGNIIEWGVSTPAINPEGDAVAEPEPKPAADPEEEETVAEWSAPEARWVTVSRFEELPVDYNRH
ncbi:MAG: hypothetical protein ACRDTG_09490 [Pseudonocardiaceae bacterium]